MSVSTMYTALSGLSSFGTALSIVSDNIANSNTTAFKSSTVEFGDLVSGYMATPSVDTKVQGSGTNILGTTTDWTTGSTLTTSNWSDVMIQGKGYFSVQDSNSNVLYTRDGSFKVDANGKLTDTHGFNVLDNAGAQITIEATPSNPVYTGYSIDKFGNIYGTNSSGQTKIATLGLTRFPNEEGLIRQGQNLYGVGSTAGTPVVNDTTAHAALMGNVVSGSLEGSNVDLAKEMVNMIIYQSDYQANSKAISTADTMLQTVVNLVR